MHKLFVVICEVAGSNPQQGLVNFAWIKEPNSVTIGHWDFNEWSFPRNKLTLNSNKATSPNDIKHSSYNSHNSHHSCRLAS